MLVLSRKINESIMIGDDVEIVVVDIRGVGGSQRVRLGINASREVSVHRKEIYLAIQQEKQEESDKHLCLLTKGKLGAIKKGCDGEGI
jgi:carbon storage regulator